MSASKIVTIMCDAPGCGQWWDGGIADTAVKARKQLAGTGWTLNVRSKDGLWRMDFCPDHTPDERESGG